MRITHPIEPLYDENSKILILGSFPSVKSREQGFFYGHNQNRFWRVIAGVFGAEVPVTIDEKKAMLLSNGIALYDVICECDIEGSADSTIKNVKPAELDKIFKNANIEKVITNGKKADELYNKYQECKTDIKAICLPSTSPANAAWSLDRLIEEWKSALI
ncbi:MAG: DNA-deoxyinosine glycosylase [Eubacterium sp.]|nr:DNA-deoxyinosine glycosylase [Eubacterium sp.]